MALLLKSASVALAAVAAALLLRTLLAAWMPPEKLSTAEKVTPFLVGSVASLYGLLTGLILTNMLANVQAVRTAASVEINALADLLRIATNLSPAIGEELADGVDVYLTSVLRDDIDAMARGSVSHETTAALGNLWATLARSTSDDPSDVALIGRAFDEVHTVGEQRRVRIDASGESLPGVLWAILIVGAVLILYGTTIAALRYDRPAPELLAGVAIMLAIVLFAIYAMDRPFRHGLATGTERYEVLWEYLHAGSPDVRAQSGRPRLRRKEATRLPRSTSPPNQPEPSHPGGAEP